MKVFRALILVSLLLHVYAQSGNEGLKNPTNPQVNGEGKSDGHKPQTPNASPTKNPDPEVKKNNAGPDTDTKPAQNPQSNPNPGNPSQNPNPTQKPAQSSENKANPGNPSQNPNAFQKPHNSQNDGIPVIPLQNPNESQKLDHTQKPANNANHEKHTGFNPTTLDSNFATNTPKSQNTDEKLSQVGNEDQIPETGPINNQNTDTKSPQTEKSGHSLVPDTKLAASDVKTDQNPVSDSKPAASDAKTNQKIDPNLSFQNSDPKPDQKSDTNSETNEKPLTDTQEKKDLNANTKSFQTLNPVHEPPPTVIDEKNPKLENDQKPPESLKAASTIISENHKESTSETKTEFSKKPIDLPVVLETNSTESAPLSDQSNTLNIPTQEQGHDLIDDFNNSDHSCHDHSYDSHDHSELHTIDSHSNSKDLPINKNTELKNDKIAEENNNNLEKNDLKDVNRTKTTGKIPESLRSSEIFKKIIDAHKSLEAFVINFFKTNLADQNTRACFYILVILLLVYVFYPSGIQIKYEVVYKSDKTFVPVLLQKIDEETEKTKKIIEEKMKKQAPETEEGKVLNDVFEMLKKIQDHEANFQIQVIESHQSIWNIIEERNTPCSPPRKIIIPIPLE